MYAAYCQTGSKTGAGNAAALKEAMTILDVSGIRPSPDQWSDLTSVVSSWDDKLDSLKETLARFRVIVAVSGSKRSSLSGYGKDTDTAVSILTADARLDRSYAYIHLPVAAILELENIPGSDFEVLGRTDLKTAQELVDLATALAANEGDLRDLRVSLHAASLVLATGLEPALEGF
jgi:hypothetical protein